MGGHRPSDFNLMIQFSPSLVTFEKNITVCEFFDFFTAT